MINEETIERIIDWAESEPLVKVAHIFGSRARNDYKDGSDLDIAVELDKPPGDENLLATWICEGDEMKMRIRKAVPEFKIDLQWLDGESTAVVFEGVNESSYVVYVRDIQSAT